MKLSSVSQPDFRTGTFASLLCLMGIVLFCSVDLSAGLMSCNKKRFLLHMSNADEGIHDAESLIVDGTPLRAYEGQPYEWTHYAIAPLPCDSDRLPAYENSGNAVVGVFLGGGAEDTLADLAPINCNEPVYLLAQGKHRH